MTFWKENVLLVVLAIMMALVVMAGVLIIADSARAAACLSIDVPPQAVINQPDGDTFHLFAFQPGGVVKIRVEGVDTPERNESGWADAKEFTRTWLAAGPFQLSTCGKSTLDRIVAKVSRQGHTLAEALKSAGLGR